MHCIYLSKSYLEKVSSQNSRQCSGTVDAPDSGVDAPELSLSVEIMYGKTPRSNVALNMPPSIYSSSKINLLSERIRDWIFFDLTLSHYDSLFVSGISPTWLMRMVLDCDELIIVIIIFHKILQHPVPPLLYKHSMDFTSLPPLITWEKVSLTARWRDFLEWIKLNMKRDCNHLLLKKAIHSILLTSGMDVAGSLLWCLIVKN